MPSLIVSGINTGVGKTLVSAIIAQSLQSAYWKPVQAGHLDYSDTEMVASLTRGVTLYPESVRLKAPLSPHHAARLEGTVIAPEAISPPETRELLVIEGSGGILTPLNDTEHLGTLFCHWSVPWILVSKHYLGSINHTLLSFEYLKMQGQSVLGLIFNGQPNPDTEQFLLKATGLPLLGRVKPELYINRRTIQWYAEKWKPWLTEMLVSCGILLPNTDAQESSLPSCAARELISSTKRATATSTRSPLGG